MKVGNFKYCFWAIQIMDRILIYNNWKVNKKKTIHTLNMTGKICICKKIKLDRSENKFMSLISRRQKY